MFHNSNILSMYQYNLYSKSSKYYKVLNFQSSKIKNCKNPQVQESKNQEYKNSQS